MKSYRNVIFLVLAAMVLFCQVSFADPQGRETKTEDTVAVILDSPPDGYTKGEIDAKLAQIREAVPVIPNRYSNDEIDAKIAGVKGAIPDVSDKYTNEEIDHRIAALKESIPTVPAVYSKEEINNKIKALNDAITTLEIALANIRNSIPAELKWPVKTKKIFTDIRIGIPADIAGTTE
jgi:uncharacterized small protein (DUF1192 family)